uniref:COMM domain-containing protein 5 n=1 Tax=Phallusia mammillata TaxID=59560 RepID=A0A6F9DAE3_9ASCI|nr:COMM domain-containing protein 5-like [Phallusia mammillata]
MSEGKTRIFLFGSRVPPEIPIMIKSMKQASPQNFEVIVKVASDMLRGNDASVFQNLSKDIDRALIETIYPGVLLILQRTLRIPVNAIKKKHFQTELMELNIPEKYHTPLIEALFSGDNCLMKTVSNPTKQMFPKVSDVKWRVDVAISTTSLNRVLEPSLLMNIKTDENKDHLFEVSKEKFHELRYSVAEVLNHMQQLEKRSVLKIDT